MGRFVASFSVTAPETIAPFMKLQYKAWLLVVTLVGMLTVASVVVSQQAISRSFGALEREQFRVEGERASRLLTQQLEGLTATLMDYAYWTDTVAFAQGTRPGYFSENFGTDNMKSLGISSVLVLDVLGRPLGGFDLTPEPALAPLSDAMSTLLRSLAVPVLADRTSRTVVRTYHRLNGQLFLIAVAAVRSPFDLGVAPSGAMAMARRFDEAELARFSHIIMHPVRLDFVEAAGDNAPLAPPADDAPRAWARTPVVDHEGRAVAHLSLNLSRDLHRAGRSLALSATLQVALTGLVMGALLVLLLNRLVLRRLQRVHEELADIGRQGLDSDHTLSVKGADELGGLARGINDLLSRSREDARQQRLAHQRQESLQLQLLQSQKTEALGRFTSGIAHDFNNSLAAISGWVRLAQEDLPARHPSDTSLDHALKSIRYASGLMKQLLSFSRQSAPRMERLRLSKVMEDVRSLVAMGLMGRCTLSVDVLTQDDWIQADPTQMKQVIVNLLINASDAMGGQGVITLVLDSQDDPPPPGDAGHPMGDPLPGGRRVTLSVCDEGPGIAPEHLDRIFDPFFTTKAAGKGTGLGLSVVHGIMARHSGTVSVRSEPGAGACFVLALPALPPSAVATDAADPSAAPRRLLYAEDEPLVREAWCALLERHGWVVTCAQDGEEAWDRFQSDNGSWDAVLTDHAMPRLNGLQLACRIGATDAPPPVVLISGQISPGDEAQLKAAGFSAVLHKPVEQDELLRVLEGAVSARAGSGSAPASPGA
jgi:signal transduction histidine kinase